MAHCGDLTNKGWSHSGHIALVGIPFFPSGDILFFPAGASFSRLHDHPTMTPLGLRDHKTPAVG